MAKSHRNARDIWPSTHCLCVHSRLHITWIKQKNHKGSSHLSISQCIVIDFCSAADERNGNAIMFCYWRGDERNRLRNYWKPEQKNGRKSSHSHEGERDGHPSSTFMDSIWFSFARIMSILRSSWLRMDGSTPSHNKNQRLASWLRPLFTSIIIHHRMTLTANCISNIGFQSVTHANNKIIRIQISKRINRPWVELELPNRVNWFRNG